jgi:Putative lumazine-binding
MGLILLFAGLIFAASPEETQVTAAVQHLFDAMAAHDGAAIGTAFVKDARMVAVRPDGTVSVTTAEDFSTRIGATKEAYLERMWEPKVLIRGAIAQLWAPYDFHREGKFNHCGIDSVSLVKVEGVWKIAGISYTSETSNCPISPLGPVH